LLVVLPHNWKDETSLLEEKKRWIFKKHAEIQSALEKFSDGKDANSLPLLGNFFEFRESRSLKIDFDAKVIECDPCDRNQLKRLEIILKRRLLHELEPVVAHYSKKLDVRFNRITIRKQRTKWGSCSADGNLNFNFQLICLPLELIRYVAYHETLHLKNRRHGKTFWKMVGEEFENYKQLEKALSEYWFFIRECNHPIFQQFL
jgi:hypothetical protein